MSYLKQPVWCISSLTGLDTNSGAPGAPLKTPDEFIRRVGNSIVLNGTQSIDVYFLDAMASRLSIQVIANSATCHFGLHGTLTQLAAGNLTSFTALSTSGNQRALITAPGLTDAYLGKLIYFPDVQTWSILQADLGGGVFAINAPLKYGATNQTDLTQANPPSTGAFIVYDASPGSFGELNFVHAYPPAGQSLWPTPFQMEQFSSPDNVTFEGAGQFFQNALVDRCLFTDINATGSVMSFFRLCHFNFSQLPQITNQKFSGCVFSGTQPPKFTDCTFGIRVTDSILWTGHTFYFLLGTNTIEGPQGFFTTDAGVLAPWRITGGLLLSEHAQDTLYGSVPSDDVVILARDSDYLYTAGVTWSVTSNTGRQFRLDGSLSNSGTNPVRDPMPSIMTAAGGSLPATAPCNTMAALQSAPFNGAAFDYTSGCSIQQDAF